MKSSTDILAEIELKIGLSWYQEMCETTRPEKWFGGAKYAYWETRSGRHLRDWYNLDIIGHLFSKRVEYLQIFHKYSQQKSAEQANDEFNQCDFDDTQRHCEYCETPFYPLKNLATVMASAGEKIWNYERRRFCQKDCSENHKWMTVCRKGMKPEAQFDKSLTPKAIWDEFGPYCYLCGIFCISKFSVLDDATRKRTWKRSKNPLTYSDTPVVEHLVPRSKGGEHMRGNVKIACNRCNLLKGDRDISPLTASKDDTAENVYFEG